MVTLAVLVAGLSLW